MSKLYTAKDLEAMLERGQSLDSVPADAKLTPMARDILRKRGARPGGASVGGSGDGGAPRIHEPELPDAEFRWRGGADPKTPAELERFFHSPELEALKRRVCQIGERIWGKGYVDGNGGNVTVRVGDNLVLCTPTLISKGFMRPEDLCMVDLEGNQVAGKRPRTSEVNTHISIMRNEPGAKACVHSHPPHATAFAVAGVTPPSCLIPEPEVFIGEIGLASYQTPGTPENAEEVGRLATRHQSILMQNHGVICWGNDVEDAYWKMENTEAFCQTVILSMQIGGPKSYGPDKLKELIEIRQRLGMPDHRLEEMKECELCDAGEFTVRTTPQPGACGCGSGETDDGALSAGDEEAVVQKITDLIMEKLA